MNKVILLGNLGATPVLRHIGSGKAVLNFTIAVDKNQQGGKTDWFDCTCWGTDAIYHAKHLTKGSRVLISGELNVRKWQDRDGNSRHNVEIMTSDIEWIFLAKTQQIAEA